MASPPTFAIFNSLRGTWALRRTLTSAIPSLPSGTFTGTATLSSTHDIDTLSPDTSSQSIFSLVYRESGDFAADNGLSFTARQRYIYMYERHDEVADAGTMSVWFAKDNTSGGGTSDVEVDYLFHKVDFDKSGTAEGSEGTWTASGDHLCSQDMYSAKYEFSLEDGKVQSWKLRFDVKGPRKDYYSEATFTNRLPQ